MTGKQIQALRQRLEDAIGHPDSSDETDRLLCALLGDYGQEQQLKAATAVRAYYSRQLPPEQYRAELDRVFGERCAEDGDLGARGG
jgi:hypothetical protein